MIGTAGNKKPPEGGWGRAKKNPLKARKDVG
jgi:hypothetical protein